MFLREITLTRERERSNRYPLSIPSIKSIDKVSLRSPVTFFVGENGTGKSTLLEGIAEQCGFNPAGGGRNNVYEVEKAESALAPYLRLSWMPKVTSGFFLRAESFYQFASHIDQVGATDSYGGRSLHAQSHGESFLSLFQNRFGKGKAIYLLDEPEAALSPQRQLAFLKIVHDLTKSGQVQFIMATHSPILLGFPQACIYSFDHGKMKEIGYKDTDHYKVTRSFLDDPNRMLHHLFKD